MFAVIQRGKGLDRKDFEEAKQVKTMEVLLVGNTLVLFGFCLASQAFWLLCILNK